MSSVDLFTAPKLAPPQPPAPVDDGKPRLRDYQLDVLERARARLRAGQRRGVIQAATGAGKTWVIAELCRSAQEKSSRVLLLADRRRLVSQLAKTLDVFRVDYGVIMAGETRDTMERVIVASRDTLHAWRRRGLNVPVFDCVLIDECHKCMGDTYQELAALWPDAVHVGFTATPARGDGKSLGDFYQWIECAIPESELIRQGYLVRPDVYAPLGVATKRKKGERGRICGDPVAHWRQYADGLPTIAFCRRVADSMDLRDRFVAADIPAEHLDASHSDEEREAAIARLVSGKTKVLSSVGLFIEGVDIPQAAAAIMYANFGSVVQWRQACGRIMRPCEGKTRAVVLDHSGAAGKHGLPGEDVDWSLALDTTVDQRRRKKLKAGEQAKTVYCPKCGHAFQGRSCPACGWNVPRSRASAAMDAGPERLDEILQAYGPTAFQRALNDELKAEIRQRHWRKCIAIATAKGAKAGFAARLFSQKHGVPPWMAKVKPLPARRDDWQRPAADVFGGAA